MLEIEARLHECLESADAFFDAEFAPIDVLFMVIALNFLKNFVILPIEFEFHDGEEGGANIASGEDTGAIFGDIGAASPMEEEFGDLGGFIEEAAREVIGESREGKPGDMVIIEGTDTASEGEFENIFGEDSGGGRDGKEGSFDAAEGFEEVFLRRIQLERQGGMLEVETDVSPEVSTFIVAREFGGLGLNFPPLECFPRLHAEGDEMAHDVELRELSLAFDIAEVGIILHMDDGFIRVRFTFQDVGLEIEIAHLPFSVRRYLQNCPCWERRDL